jgi:hypothetical protein
MNVFLISNVTWFLPLPVHTVGSWSPVLFSSSYGFICVHQTAVPNITWITDGGSSWLMFKDRGINFEAVFSTVVYVMITLVWYVICSQVDIYFHLRGTCCFHLHSLSWSLRQQTPLKQYQATQCHILDEINVHSHHHENNKSHRGPVHLFGT